MTQEPQHLSEYNLTDKFSGDVLSEAELRSRYETYVDELHADHPDTAQCSYRHWLRGEIGVTILESKSHT